MINKNLLIYAATTFSYGFIRKIDQVKSANINYFNEDIKKIDKRPMLLTSKILLTSFSGIASLYIWPIYMYNDMNRMEIYIKNKDPTHYGYNLQKYEIDYFFS